jgi:hypothetical protein
MPLSSLLRQALCVRCCRWCCLRRWYILLRCQRPRTCDDERDERGGERRESAKESACAILLRGIFFAYFAPKEAFRCRCAEMRELLRRKRSSLAERALDAHMWYFHCRLLLLSTRTDPKQFWARRIFIGWNVLAINLAVRLIIWVSTSGFIICGFV